MLDSCRSENAGYGQSVSEGCSKDEMLGNFPPCAKSAQREHQHGGILILVPASHRGQNQSRKYWDENSLFILKNPARND